MHFAYTSFIHFAVLSIVLSILLEYSEASPISFSVEPKGFSWPSSALQQSFNGKSLMTTPSLTSTMDDSSFPDVKAIKQKRAVAFAARPRLAPATDEDLVKQVATARTRNFVPQGAPAHKTKGEDNDVSMLGSSTRRAAAKPVWE